MSLPLVLIISALVGVVCFAIAYSMTLSEEEAQAELDAYVAERLREDEGHESS